MSGRHAGPIGASGWGIRPMGRSAWLVELPSLHAMFDLRARLTRSPLPGQREVVAGARTLLLRGSDATDAERMRAALDALTDDADPGEGRDAGAADPAAPVAAAAPVATAAPAREITIDVVYDGEDLDEVAALLGLDADGLIAAHTGAAWTAAFAGFAPGFLYLAGDDPRFSAPRRATPRTRVPAGAVGLAGGFCGVYPRSSPGGWQLIGRTDAVLWDLRRSSPALLAPGDRVRFHAVRGISRAAVPEARPRDASGPGPTGGAGAAGVSGAAGDPGAEDAAGGAGTAEAGEATTASALVVEDPGLLALIEDGGRPGLADLGVSPSGPADRRSAAQANRLVGNAPGAALVESVLGALTVTARGDQVCAISGAVAELTAGGRAVAPDTPFALRDGERLELGPATAGLRCYLAVRGGLDVPATLGSAAADTLSGLGPAPLTAGTVLPVGAARGVVADPRPGTLDLAVLDPDAVLLLPATPGPRDDRFAPPSIAAFWRTLWAVEADSNRVGVRLRPTTPGGDRHPSAPLPVLQQRDGLGELSSEGMLAGAVQVPPGGAPVVFLADHPVTGGYPVIAVVDDEGVALLAQAAPGRRVRFVRG